MNLKTRSTKMRTLFGRDEQFALATVGTDGPSNRFVDTYFTDGSFYIVTYALSRKAKETAADPRAARCAPRAARLFRKGGKHRSSAQTRRTRKFAANWWKRSGPWYFRHNNEDDPNMCYLRFAPKAAFFRRAVRDGA